MNKILHRGAFLTDIHFGKKSNSTQHNQDCLNYLDWFCEQVKADPSIDYIGFLGDWHEKRTALNISTLKYSYQGAKKLNNLDLPVFFCVGNHDLYYRNSRDTYSTMQFNEFDNFEIIDNPKIIENIYGKALFCPFLFPDEYPTLSQYLKIPFWAGHFEFKDFVVTGHGMKMKTGPDAKDFKGPANIISGHFHKRQSASNITYMGNTFPMDFSDSDDTERGMMVFDHDTNQMKFIDWADCPKYQKVKLSELLDNSVTIHESACIHCLADVPISYEESLGIRETYIDTYKLREFSMEESAEIQQAIEDTDVDDIEQAILTTDCSGLSIDEIIVKLLSKVEVDSIDNQILIDQYNSLKL